MKLKLNKTFSFSVLILIVLQFLLSTTNLLAEDNLVEDEFILGFDATSGRSEKIAYSLDLGLQTLKLNSVSQTVHAKGKLNQLAAKKLLASGQVKFIEPNYLFRAFRQPEDPLYPEQWASNNTTTNIDLDLQEAWEQTTGDREIVVALVDSGIEYTHPDLKNNLWLNTREIPKNGKDDDGNGIVDDIYGFNSISEDGQVFDELGHGTHCAGIIGAEGDNSLGVSGVNWQVKLMALKFMNDSGVGTTQDAIEAIEYALKMKAEGVNIRVINSSWGGYFHSQALENVIRAANDAGILFVAAAGNFGSNNDSNPIYPASYQIDNIISVGAIDKEGNLASFSNYGESSVDLAAPGVEILSTEKGNTYSFRSGTSMAAPYVSGVAALLAAKEPILTAGQLKSRLLNTTKTLATLDTLVRTAGMISASGVIDNTLSPEVNIESDFSYYQEDFPANNLASLGEKIPLGDDGYYKLQLGFDFLYYGKPYSALAVSANGRLIPLTSTDSLPTEFDHSNSFKPGILPWHDDLVAASNDNGGVWVYRSNQLISINWVSKVFGHRNDSNPDFDLRVEARIYKNGTIEFHFHDTENSTSNFQLGASSSVGLMPMNPRDGARVKVTHNTALPSRLSSGMAVRFLTKQRSVKNDIDGDGKSDLVVWRPASGMWFFLTSSSNLDIDSYFALQLGLPQDIPLSGDFDGDGLMDPVVWREQTGEWFFRLSTSSFSEISRIQWGLPGDSPIVADVDGDGKDDLTVYRSTQGLFFSLLSSNEFDPLSPFLVPLGDQQSTPLLADFNGDQIADYTTFLRPQGIWTSARNNGEIIQVIPWGEALDQAMTCDWDHDGLNDHVIVRSDSSSPLLNWYVATTGGAVYTAQFGIDADIPSCNKDFDGDGKTDIAVWRPQDGNWFLSNNTPIQFGLPGDIPL